MNICITGGGTGGHLMIAKVLAKVSKKRKHKLIFIGSTKGQDRNYFEKKSHFENVYFLKTTGVVNQIYIFKLFALLKIIKALFISIYLLKKHSINAVYSVGGFSSAPASIASIILNIPLFIHEQNAVEGRLNSLLKKFSKRFISAYDKNCSIKGYPVDELFIQNARVRNKLKTIIILGGSQGAKALNNLAISIALELKEKGIQIIHQAGQNDFDRVKKEYEKLGVEVELYAFTQDIASLISRADFALSRSGASTLWELSINGLPAFYIPYPYAAGDHQFYNAKFIVDRELGWCEREGDNLRDKLLEAIKEPLKEKSQKLISFSNKSVADEMIDELEKF